MDVFTRRVFCTHTYTFVGIRIVTQAYEKIHRGLQTACKKKKNTSCTCTASKCVNALPQIHSHPNKTKPGHIPLCPCAGSSPCLILHLKSLSGRSESLTNPPIFLWVRDLHSNGWALSTGEPDEEQSRVVVLLPRTASAFCYSPPPGSGSCLSVCGAKGGG